MQLDEWRMFQITPFNREIQNIKMSPPLISQPTADSFPPGEAKNRNQNPPPFNAQLNFPTLRADSIRPYSHGGRAAYGSTASRPLQWRVQDGF